MMTPTPDTQTLLDAAETVAQFEPDFDGTWDEPSSPAVASEGADDPQWIVWPDLADAAMWAATALTFAWAAAAGLAERRA